PRLPVPRGFKPGRPFFAHALLAVGRNPIGPKDRPEGRLLRGGRLALSGRTLGEEAAAAKETPGQEVVRKFSSPLKSTGGLVILKGNLAPEGCVVKVAGHNLQNFRGPARVFDRSEERRVGKEESSRLSR